MQWPKTCVSQKLKKKSRNRVTVLKSWVYKCLFLYLANKHTEKSENFKNIAFVISNRSERNWNERKNLNKFRGKSFFILAFL